MNRRFQAQTQARLGLDRMRREVHCAMSVVDPSARRASATLTHPGHVPDRRRGHGDHLVHGRERDQPVGPLALPPAPPARGTGKATPTT